VSSPDPGLPDGSQSEVEPAQVESREPLAPEPVGAESVGTEATGTESAGTEATGTEPAGFALPGSGSTDDDAGPKPPEAKAEKSGGGSFWKELPFLVLIALVLALLIKTFLVQAFYIPSASMENTLQGGDFGNSTGHPYDRVLVNKLVYDFRDPHRGEIVVFKRPAGSQWPDESTFITPSNPIAKFFHDIGSAIGISPSGGSDFIKRVIGIGGDTVACTKDVLSVNGKVLDEPFLYPGSQPCVKSNGGSTWSVHVPKGDLFMMGDHRDDSSDSRDNGFVPTKDVVGRAFLVIWPIKDWKTLPIPSTFKQAGLSAMSSSATPYVAGAAMVLPIPLLRRRRRNRKKRASPSVG
jgi:signal peptidase I